MRRILRFRCVFVRFRLSEPAQHLMNNTRLAIAWVAVLLCFVGDFVSAVEPNRCETSFVGAAQDGPAGVQFTVVEKKTGQALPCRIHVFDKAGKPQRAGALPFFRDHFVCPGQARLELSPGDYTYEIERGPEYARGAGGFSVQDGKPVKVAVELERLVDLAAEGWWSGETHVHRPVADVELLMRAEDLHLAPVITWWQGKRSLRSEWTKAPRLPDEPLVRFDGNRYYHQMAGEDEREGGALLYFNLRRPLVFGAAGPEAPSPLKFAAEARHHPSVWIDCEKPFWWDVPVWFASGQVDSIGLANNHMCRSQMLEDEAWGKPRDAQRLPAPRGNGFWTQEIYYHVLNCGLRVPPSAGSASGVLPNPVGYNRVYVHIAEGFSYEKWWQALRAGRSFVTNGPLLRVLVNGQQPGHVFTAPAGQENELEISATLTTRDTIPAFEIIKNGRVERAVAPAQSGSLGKLRFTESGWFLVRTIADNPKTFRFASTAPYYVEIGASKRRVSRASARFFLDWSQERAGRIKLADATQQREVMQYHLRAKEFWEKTLRDANAD